MILYKKMSLFDAPKDSLILHAVNAQGVWGSGIAKEFKKRYPKSYEDYKLHCTLNKNPMDYPALICDKENDHEVCCLFTSENYGNKVSTPDKILSNTINALHYLSEEYRIPTEIYSNKFNSGLFNVPWEKTEDIIKSFSEHFNITWIVCDPNLEN